jgi:hypothetical protein
VAAPLLPSAKHFFCADCIYLPDVRDDLARDGAGILCPPSVTNDRRAAAQAKLQLEGPFSGIVNLQTLLARDHF